MQPVLQPKTALWHLLLFFSVFINSAVCQAQDTAVTTTGETVRNLHGTVKANAVVDMRMPVSGAVTSTQRRMGERIQADEILLQIDDREAQENLGLRRAELQRSEAENELALKQWQRIKASHERGVIADLEVDKAYLEYQQRQAERRIAQARMHMAVIHLSNHRLVALTNGVLVEDAPPQGQFLRANEPVLSLLDDSVQSIIVQLNETEIDRLQKGELGLLQQDETESAYRIARIAPRVLENSTLIEVEVVPVQELSRQPTVGSLVPLKLTSLAAQGIQQELSIGSVANRDSRPQVVH